MKPKTLREILCDADNSMGSDFEGSCTYRVHISTVKQLIQDAYKAGSEAGGEHWKTPLINEAICLHIYQKEHETNPQKVLNDVISWNVKMALDPAISSDAAELIERGKQLALTSK